MFSRRSSQAAAAAKSPCRALESAERVQGLTGRFEAGHLLPCRRRPLRVGQRLLLQARQLGPEGSGGTRLAPIFQDASLLLQDDGEVRRPAGGREDLGEPTDAGDVARLLGQVGPQDLGRVGLPLGQILKAHDLQAQRQPAFRFLDPLQLGHPQRRRLAVTLLRFVQAGQGVAHRLAVRELVGQQPPDGDGPRTIVQDRLGQLGRPLDPGLPSLGRERQARAFQQQGRRAGDLRPVSGGHLQGRPAARVRGPRSLRLRAGRWRARAGEPAGPPPPTAAPGRSPTGPDRAAGPVTARPPRAGGPDCRAPARPAG